MYNPLDDEIRLLNEIEENRCSRTKCLKLPKALKLSDPIRKIPTRQLILLPDTATLEKTVSIMQTDHFCCMLLVNDTGCLTGIFTDRDLLVKVVGRGLNYKNEIIRDYMTLDPETLMEDDPIAFALNKMIDGGFRNIPIVNDDMKPLGIISMGCLIRYLGEYYHNEVVNLPPRPIRSETSRFSG